jgi:hypothetical protein
MSPSPDHRDRGVGASMSRPRRTVSIVILLAVLLSGMTVIVSMAAVVWRLHQTSRIHPARPGRPVTVGDRCPACRTGTIRSTNGRFGDFLGCSTYPACGAAWRNGIRVRAHNYGRLG